MPETQLAVAAPEAARRGITDLPSWTQRMEEHEAWPILSRLQAQLTVRVALDKIKVRDLLRLEQGQVLHSPWSHTNDVPLMAGEVRLAWSEFEVSGQRIGVRITQLA